MPPTTSAPTSSAPPTTSAPGRDGFEQAPDDAATPGPSLGCLNIGLHTDLAPVWFTGMSLEGFLTVATTGPTQVSVLHLAPGSLHEVGDLQQNFPRSLTRIETHDDGLGQIWIDGGNLCRPARGALKADLLPDDVLAAWFVDD